MMDCIFYLIPEYVKTKKKAGASPPNGQTDEQLAAAGLSALESWMKEIGLVMNLQESGVTEDMIEGIADATILLTGGYKMMTRDDVVTVLKASL